MPCRAARAAMWPCPWARCRYSASIGDFQGGEELKNTDVGFDKFHGFIYWCSFPFFCQWFPVKPCWLGTPNKLTFLHFLGALGSSSKHHSCVRVANSRWGSMMGARRSPAAEPAVPSSAHGESGALWGSLIEAVVVLNGSLAVSKLLFFVWTFFLVARFS